MISRHDTTPPPIHSNPRPSHFIHPLTSHTPCEGGCTAAPQRGARRPREGTQTTSCGRAREPATSRRGCGRAGLRGGVGWGGNDVEIGVWGERCVGWEWSEVEWRVKGWRETGVNNTRGVTYSSILTGNQTCPPDIPFAVTYDCHFPLSLIPLISTTVNHHSPILNPSPLPHFHSSRS